MKFKAEGKKKKQAKKEEDVFQKKTVTVRKKTYVDQKGIQMCDEAHPNIPHNILEQELSGKRQDSEYLSKMNKHTHHELENHAQLQRLYDDMIRAKRIQQMKEQMKRGVRKSVKMMHLDTKKAREEIKF